MSDRPVKCLKCSEWFRRSETDHVYDEKKKRYFHTECYDIKLNATEDRDSLYAYMCELFGYEFVEPRIQNQVTKMMEDYRYTYKGIELSMRYAYEIEHMDKAKANGGVGIVPWFYKRAGEFYKKKMKIWEVKEINYEKVEVKVILKEDKPNKKLIDIGGL